MNRENAIKQNFKMHSSKMTADFFVTNMRPVAVRTSLRYLTLLVMKRIFSLSISSVTNRLRLQRNSYYGIKDAVSQRIRLSEEEIIEALENEYHFSDLIDDSYDHRLIKSSNHEIYRLAEKICKDKMNVSSERFIEAFGLEEER